MNIKNNNTTILLINRILHKNIWKYIFYNWNNFLFYMILYFNDALIFSYQTNKEYTSLRYKL